MESIVTTYRNARAQVLRGEITVDEAVERVLAHAEIAALERS